MNPRGYLAALAACAGVVACTDSPRISAPTDPLPQHLADTGLFVRGSKTQVQPGVLPFSPQYPLWSDGATKRRWIALPPGTFIDASRPQAWDFPRGTRFWKEFSLDGRRVETRFIERLADGSWRFATYVWNEAETEAVLASAEGMPAYSVKKATAPGREQRYAIPSEADCRACHEGAAVPVLGFTALQLSPDRDPLAPHAEPLGADDIDLRALLERGWLRNLPQQLIATPPRIAAASDLERAALGYLNANCGHCHLDAEDSDAAVPVDVLLAQDVTDADGASRVLRSLMDTASGWREPGTQRELPLIAPGQSHRSALPIRMRSRDPRVQMPPLGTAIPDTKALALIERWIDTDLATRESSP
jgi:hypothetical protein